MMGERDLRILLRRMDPELHEGEWVFCSGAIEGAIATFLEQEGPTSVIRRERADELGLPYSYVASWISLNVESDLDAVGLLAAVTAALAEEGISCNVFSALRHDHLFVPAVRSRQALDVLRALQR